MTSRKQVIKAHTKIEHRRNSPVSLQSEKSDHAAISDEDASGIFPAGRLEQMQGILADRVVEYIPIASDKIFESELFLSDAM